MSEPIAYVAPDGAKIEDVGFAKLHGKEFQFFMRTYNMILGRDTKKEKVDLDLSTIGGSKDISHHHAHIFYDFKEKVFFLEVLGKKGCTVQGTFYLPGDDPVKLKSQDLIQIGELQFYFLLPRCSIFETFAAQRAHVPSQPPSSSVSCPAHVSSQPPCSSNMPAHVPSQPPSSSGTRPAHTPPKKSSSSVKRPADIPSKPPFSSIMPPAHVPSQPPFSSVTHPAHIIPNTPSTSIMPPAHVPSQPPSSSIISPAHSPSLPPSSSIVCPAHTPPQSPSSHDEGNGDNGTRVDTATEGGDTRLYTGPISVEPIGIPGERVDNVKYSTNEDTGNQQVQLKEEEDIISRIATLISNNCAPTEWMPVEKLHSELIDHFGKIQHLIMEDGPSTEIIRKPWYNLLELLKKHPEHFVISTLTRGTATLEFVALESSLI